MTTAAIPLDRRLLVLALLALAVPLGGPARTVSAAPGLAGPAHRYDTPVRTRLEVEPVAVLVRAALAQASAAHEGSVASSAGRFGTSKTSVARRVATNTAELPLPKGWGGVG